MTYLQANTLIFARK